MSSATWPPRGAGTLRWRVWPPPVHEQLARAKTAVGDLRRALELRTGCLDEGSAELWDAYRDVAEAYDGVLDFDKALPLCLKALGIAERLLGEDSAEVARVRPRRRARAVAYVTIIRWLRSLSSQERIGGTKWCLEIACGIIDTKDSVNSGRIAEAYAEIPMLDESMAEFETSLSSMKKKLAIIEGAKEMQHVEGSLSARMGVAPVAVVHTKRVVEAVPYLETAVDKLKIGPQHFGLGFAYKHLGKAYLEMDKHESAMKFLTLAKGIIRATFGPTHDDSIDTNQSLANAYGLMGSYKLAMDFQEQVIDAYKSCGTDSSEELREAYRLLEQLRMKAKGLRHAVFPANSLPVLPKHND